MALIIGSPGRRDAHETVAGEKEGMMVPQGGPEHGTSKGQPQVGSKEFPKGKAS